MSFDFDLIVRSFPLLLAGAVITVQITAISVGCGMLIGMFAGIARLAKIWPVRFLASVYVDFIRGTPLLVQIFIIYFALPLVVGQRIDPFIAAITACSINSGAYVAEIFRAGIQSIDKGQMEAGRSLGFSYTQTMIKIIIPQAFFRMLAPLTNEFISLTKNSSLLSTITVVELFRQANILIADTYRTIEFLLAIAVLYYLFNNLIGLLGMRLEKHFRTGGELQ